MCKYPGRDLVELLQHAEGSEVAGGGGVRLLWDVHHLPLLDPPKLWVRCQVWYKDQLIECLCHQLWGMHEDQLEEGNGLSRRLWGAGYLSLLDGSLHLLCCELFF